MKVAIPYENESIFQHFGHTAAFKIYTIQGGKNLDSQVIGTGASGHSALAGLLAQEGVQALICGGIGSGARMALAQSGIAVYGGVSGDADEAAEAFADGVLLFDPNARCSHHSEGHTCSSHSCH